jgi:hypothetical protein
MTASRSARGPPEFGTCAERLEVVLRFGPVTSQFSTAREQWPGFEVGETSTVFSPRPPLRKLIVVIDHDLLEEPALRRSDEDRLLAGLISHPYVEVLRIGDDGPPGEVHRLTGGPGVEYAPGWILLGSPREKTGDVPLVQASEDGKSITRGTLIGNAHELARSDSGSDAYAELGPAEATRHRVADVRALEAAVEVGADLMVTERPYLRALTWDLSQRVVRASPGAALPLVGLYLRREGSFLTYRSADGNATAALNRGLWYWVAARDLLPAGWRWLSVCVRAGDEGERLGHLARSVLGRVQRALQERDAVLWALNQPQDNDIAGDALDSLDGVLLRLMGAVDATARVAHRVLAIEDDEYGAAWQRKKWRRRVAEVAPGLAAIVAPGSDGAYTVEILRLLRNSIHGTALQPLAVASRPGQRDATLVGLPSEDALRLVDAMDALGGSGHFGVREVLPGRVHADPGELVDEVFRRTVDLLNRLMEETPVERVAGELVPEAAGEAPVDDIFSAPNRESIRSQLGLLLAASRQD